MIRGRMNIFRVCWVVILACAYVYAQDRSAQPPAPKTRVETFEAQSGIVIIRGFSVVGELKGALGGITTVQSMEFTNAANRSKEFGISIDIKETGRLERSNRSFIDYDEIESLLKGLDYVGKIDKSVTPLDNFQADFRTRGGFQISTFNSAANGGRTMVALQSGAIGSTSMYLNMEDLPRFRDMIANGKAKLDSIKPR
jgi:hypothetical protein